MSCSVNESILVESVGGENGHGVSLEAGEERSRREIRRVSSTRKIMRRGTITHWYLRGTDCMVNRAGGKRLEVLTSFVFGSSSSSSPSERSTSIEPSLGTRVKYVSSGVGNTALERVVSEVRDEKRVSSRRDLEDGGKGRARTVQGSESVRDLCDRSGELRVVLIVADGYK